MRQSVLPPRSFSSPNNSGCRSSRNVRPNCFRSLLVYFLCVVMNGPWGLECNISSADTLWDQNIHGWPLEVSKAGRRTNLAASRAVCGELWRYFCKVLLFGDGRDLWGDWSLKETFSIFVFIDPCLWLTFLFLYALTVGHFVHKDWVIVDLNILIGLMDSLPVAPPCEVAPFESKAWPCPQSQYSWLFMLRIIFLKKKKQVWR